MSIVLCKMPKAGLGNQLFPLMKAHVFAQLNRLPIIVTGYHHLKTGPYLRREKNKRKYNGFFRFQKSFLAAAWEKRKLLAYKDKVPVFEPVVANIGAHFLKGTAYIFSATPHWDDYFQGLKENREVVIDLLGKILKPEIINELSACKPPYIGVHIRMGDFRKLKTGENFNDLGAVRTPEHYFIEVIGGIRKIHESDLPVSIFTDGYKEELGEILSLENIQIIDGNNDLVDMLLLSRSKIIITSAGSTFSYWAGFLSDAPVIMHPGHLHQSLRPEEVNAKWYEGPFDQGNELLLENIKGIQY